MPTDISHQPPSPGWVIPHVSGDTHPAVTDWLTHIAAGRIGGNPPPAPHVLARRLATEVQFAAYRREVRA